MGRPNQSLRSEVQAVLKSGRVHRGRLVHVRVGPAAVGRTLISVRRRYGSAVERNLVRRRLREICRAAGVLPAPGKLVFITVSDHSGGASFWQLSRDLQNAFSSLCLT